MATLEYSHRAEIGIVAIQDRIAQADPRAAVRVVERLQQSADLVARFPLIGRNGRVPGTRELSVPNVPYFLVYEPIKDGVRVLDIVHARRNWPPIDPPAG